MEEQKTYVAAKCSKKKSSGVITAFFSLILLLVIVLLVTMAETARVTACSRVSKILIEISTKSLLGSYDLPLYENYHIFGRYCNGAGSGSTSVLQKELEWYIKENMGGETWLDMYPKEIEIAKSSVLTDSNGSSFYGQALQYAKYQDAALLIEWMLQAAGLVKQAEETGVVAQKKYAVDNEAAQAEEVLIRLLGCIDGFQISEGTFARDRKGKLKTQSTFAKKMVPGEATQERVMPGNPDLYDIQKNNYCDPIKILSQVLEYQQQVIKEEEALQQMYQAAEGFRQQYELIPKTDIVERRKLESTLAQLQRAMQDSTARISEYLQRANEQLALWRTGCQQANEQSKTALALIAELKEKKKTAADVLQNFGIELKEYQQRIPEELYQDLEQENREYLEILRQGNSMGILEDIAGMENALQNNIKIFEQALQEAPIIDGRETALAGSSQIQKLLTYMGQLQVEPLNFHYEDIQSTALENGYGTWIKQFIKYGFTGLVLEDPKAASYNRLKDSSAPSSGYAKESEKNEYSLGDLFSWGEDKSFFPDSEALGEVVKTGANTLLEQGLYLSYLMEHFTAYTDFVSEQGQEKSSEKGLMYQLEYILYGKEKDFDNLSSAISRIFLIRFAANIGTILCSSECRQQAKKAAAAIIGFTGIGALVLALELLIELLWAAECAAVETAVLLKDGDIPFFSSKNELTVKFSELLTLSKSRILEKAEGYLKQEKKGILTEYKDYLLLFLLLEKKDLRTLRTMDVVQQTMQVNYYDTFQLKDCIYSITADINLTIPYRFLPVVGLGQGKGVSRTFSYGISY